MVVAPADLLAADTRGVCVATRRPALSAIADEAMAGSVMDATQLLDVDVDQFARTSSLIALWRLERPCA
jgi:hypothetical protein